MQDENTTIRTYLPAIRRFALLLTCDRVRADDLLQKTVAWAVERADELERESDLEARLLAVVQSLHADETRSTIRNSASVDSGGWTVADAVSASQDRATELGQMLARFRSLEETDQQIVLMVAVDRMTYEEVADRLEIALGAVKSRLARARKNLRNRHTPAASTRKKSNAPSL